MLDEKAYLALALLDPISPKRLLGGTRAHLPGLHIELRPMPEALDGPANQHAVGEGPAAVRAAVLERAVALAAARQRDAGAVIEPDKLHLVDLELVHLRHDGAARTGGIGSRHRQLFPFPGARVSM